MHIIDGVDVPEESREGFFLAPRGEAARDRVTRVQADAGSGKTSTSKLPAEQDRRTGVYLAYNEP